MRQRQFCPKCNKWLRYDDRFCPICNSVLYNEEQIIRCNEYKITPKIVSKDELYGMMNSNSPKYFLSIILGVVSIGIFILSFVLLGKVGALGMFFMWFIGIVAGGFSLGFGTGKGDNSFANDLYNRTFPRNPNPTNTAPAKPIVMCPYCKSTNVVKLSMLGKVVSVEVLGAASNKIGKQWHCNDCDSNF